MNLIMMMRPLRARIWPGYMLAVALSVAALWIRFEIGVTLSDSPYLTFVVAVLLASFLGGFGPGLLALVLSALLAKYYLIEPVGSLELVWPAGWIGMILFLFTAGTIVLLMRAVLNAHEAQMRSEAEVHALNADLEARVVERTACSRRKCSSATRRRRRSARCRRWNRSVSSPAASRTISTICSRS